MPYKTYTKKPIDAAAYSRMRGVTDFTNAEQLNMFEKGHGLLVVINTPKFIDMLAEEDTNIENLQKTFTNILEYEFKGLDGIEDINAEDLVYSDGISELAGVGKVTEQSNSEITMRFTEKSGSAITKYIKYYLSGVRDSRTQTKTYHGLIARGILPMGFQHEVFNFLYLVTDASGLQLEAAYLLANAWPNSAKTQTLYNSEKGTIESAEIDVTFKCFVLQSEQVNKRALKMLASLVGKNYDHTYENDVVGSYVGIIGSSDNKDSDAKGEAETQKTFVEDTIKWDSSEYIYKGLTNIEEALPGNTTTTSTSTT